VLLFIGGLSASEIAIVLVIGLLLFGSRLPQVGRSLGKTLTEFKRGLRGMEDDMESLDRETDKQLEEEERARKKALPPPDPDRPAELPADHPAEHPASGGAGGEQAHVS
jgi:sec-independent protein translocase protein TatA